MPNDIVTLSAEEYQALLAERDALRGELRLAKAERDLAEERLRAYKHELFGASSEARATDQLGLFNEAEALGTDATPAREAEAATQVAGHTRGKRGRKPLDPNLPREIVLHELPESDRFCSHDGHTLVVYRQATLLRRFGGDISSNTLAASVVRVGLAAQPVINLMRDVLLDSELIYGDETTFQVLKEPGRRPQSKSYLWAQVNGSGPPVRIFSYSPGRGAQHAQRLYEGVKPGAVLMTDGYELYNGIARDQQLVHLGCWAHVRRGFINAEETVPKAARTPDLLATRFVELIGKLFAVEARAAKWTAERRRRLRARYCSRVLAVIEHMMVRQLPTIVPSSLLGKALQYMRGQWPKLVRYVENGNWPISNNLCENAIRPFVVGRKGWLFADTVAGAQASANLYSLVETCKAIGIDPYHYLVSLFAKLPLASGADDYAALMPWAPPAAPNL